MKVHAVLLLIASLVVIMDFVNGVGEMCKSTSECNDKNNEKCRTSEGCSRGVCTCKRGYYKGANAVCIRLRSIGEACTSHTDCGKNAHCPTSPKTCQCLSSSYKSDDKINCRDLRTTSINGEPCSNSNATCHMAAGVYCTGTACNCPGGSSWQNDLFPFDRDYGFFTGACVNSKSKTGRGSGKRCTPILSTGYSPLRPMLVCSGGLDCNLCPEESQLISTPNYECNKRDISGAPRLQTGSFTFLLTASLFVARHILAL